MYYESKGKILRQKAISLMYLIFLAFLFTYVPSGFLDSVHHSNKSFDLLSKDASRENTANNLYFLSLLKSDPELYEQTKQDFLAIEDYSSTVQDFIDDIKLRMISVDKTDDYGYFVNGKKEKTSEDIMMEQRLADSVLRTLVNYKNYVLEFIGYKHLKALDEILPMPNTIARSDGQFAQSSAFFFSKTPLNVAILNLNHFRSGIERIKIYSYRELMKYIIEINKQNLPFEVLQSFRRSNPEGIGNARTLRQFFETLENDGWVIEETKDAVSTSYFSVESMTDTIYPEGYPLKFNIQFDSTEKKSVTVSLTGPGEARSFVLTKPGPFLYLPLNKGRYHISFSDGQKRVSKFIKIIDVEPLIQNTKLSTIYTGIDNALNIRTSEFGSKDQLVPSISKGEIFRKGDKFYARVAEEGIVQVSIFAKMSYGVIKVAEQMFAVRPLKDPYVTINNFPTGSVLSAAQLKSLRNISVNTDEYLVEEQFFVADFEVSVIYNNHTGITKPLRNTGASFNSFLLELMKDAKPGDIYIFDKIRAKSTLGNERMVHSYSLVVK
jgi:hypothetical protein